MRRRTLGRIERRHIKGVVATLSGAADEQKPPSVGQKLRVAMRVLGEIHVELGGLSRRAAALMDHIQGIPVSGPE